MSESATPDDGRTEVQGNNVYIKKVPDSDRYTFIDNQRGYTFTFVDVQVGTRETVFKTRDEEFAPTIRFKYNYPPRVTQKLLEIESG